jgi:aerotaxis receptor
MKLSINLGNKETHLDSNTMIVTETDEKGIILFASKDFCKIAEYSEEELIGHPHNLVRHPFMPKSAFNDLWSSVKKGETWNGIVVNKTKSGGFYWVNATVYPSKRRDGSIKYVSVRVVASKEEIENAIKLYSTLN